MAIILNNGTEQHILTEEEARKGGIRSGEVRKEKATMKKTLEMLLNEKNNKGKTYRELSTLGLIKGAVDGKADKNAQDIVTANENVMTPKLEIEVVDNENLEEVMYENK